VRIPGRPTPHHSPQYVLVDVGTFGGPSSFFNCCGNVPPVLNPRGVLVGEADTNIPNPHAANPNPNCVSLSDPAVEGFGFAWNGGTLTDLGALPGGYNSYALSISPNGSVVGNSENGQNDPLLSIPSCVGVLWKAGGIVDLGTLGGGYESIAFALNDKPQAVGSSANTIPDSLSFFGWNTQARAFLWQDGVLRDLGTLGTGNDAAAGFINSSGQIAGFSYTNNPASGTATQDPFFWERGRMIDLGTLGGTFGLPNDLNERGQVVGQMNLAGDTTYHPFLWSTAMGLRDLGTLGGANGFATQINSAGEVVGRADISPSSSDHHAFLWKHGVIHDLGLPPGGAPCSTSYAINTQDQVVGDAGVCGVGGVPFLWENGVNYALNSLVLPGSDLTLGDVNVINDRGEIACTGTDPSGNIHACLLVPLDQARREGLTRLMRNTRAPAIARSAAGRYPSVRVGRQRMMRAPFNRAPTGA
jgi:probable HAF family extracellular repeat protein